MLLMSLQTVVDSCLILYICVRALMLLMLRCTRLICCLSVYLLETVLMVVEYIGTM